MSGQGKRKSSSKAPEEPSGKRQRLEEPEHAATHDSTNRQIDTGSQWTYGYQTEHDLHLQATHQSQPIFHSQPNPQPQFHHEAQTQLGSSAFETSDTDSASGDDDVPEGAGPTASSETKGKRRASSPAPDEPGSKKGASARSQKRAGMKSAGRNDKERDEVEVINGRLFWRDPQTGESREAVYHDQIRGELIADASVHGSYYQDRKRGTKAHDETSFLLEQRDWVPERAHWPRIRHNVLNMHLKGDYKGTYNRQAVEGTWIHTDGRLIIDRDNHPVRKFPDLPATLSSAVEGWYLEVLSRLDNRIQRRDFWARLPHGRDKVGSKPASDEIFGLSALGNRRNRWRISEGLVSWKTRVGSSELNAFLTRTIPQASLDRNSNEGGRALTPQEVKEANAINEGKQVHQKKGRGRKPRSKKTTSEKGVSNPSKPESSNGQILLPGQPDPTSPSLIGQTRPLSRPLGEMESARDNAGYDDPSAHSHIGGFNGPLPGVDPFFGLSQFHNPFDISGDEDGVLDGSQEQLWNSLTYQDLGIDGVNDLRAEEVATQDDLSGISTSRTGKDGWYQPNFTDAAESAMQARRQRLQQDQYLADNIDLHTGPSESAAQFNTFGPLMNYQQWGVNAAETSWSSMEENEDMYTHQKLQGNGQLNVGEETHTPDAPSYAAESFATRQMAHPDFQGLMEQTTRFADGLSVPPQSESGPASQESEAQRHRDFLTALYDSPLLAQIGEQAMSSMNDTTPTSIPPLVTPAAGFPHTDSDDTNPSPLHGSSGDQATSSKTTTPPSSGTSSTTYVEPCFVAPKTRLQHAVIWKLLKPTRQAFKAHFQDDAWRAYVPKDFVPPSDVPLSYMSMFDKLSMGFWDIWTARYGFGVEVPPLMPPGVIDEKAARILGGGLEGSS